PARILRRWGFLRLRLMSRAIASVSDARRSRTWVSIAPTISSVSPRSCRASSRAEKQEPPHPPRPPNRRRACARLPPPRGAKRKKQAQNEESSMARRREPPRPSVARNRLPRRRGGRAGARFGRGPGAGPPPEPRSGHEKLHGEHRQ